MVQGIFNTSHFPANLAKLSFAGMISRLMPNGSAPLFAITAQIPSETATNTLHGFFSKTMVFPYGQINLLAGYNAAATVLVLDSTATLLPNMILRVERTGENVIINSVDSATQITVTRAVGTVAAAAIVDDDFLYQIGTAFEEAATRPTAQAIVPVPISNLTQIFRNTWSLSGTAQAVQVIAGDTTEAENRQDCAGFHATDIEKSMIFGQKSQGTRNGKPFRTMDGLLSLLQNVANYPPSYNSVVNVFTAGSTTNWTQLLAMLDPVFDQATDPKGSSERVLFCGGSAKLVINEIGRLNGTYQLVDGQTNFGLAFSTLTTPRGKFRIIEHPLFNSNPIWSKIALVVDLPTFRLAYLGGRKTKSEEFNTSGLQAQDNGIDAVGGSLLTECTATFKNVPANAIIFNLTAAAQG